MGKGIFGQSAASVLEDVDEFFFGGCTPWIEAISLDAPRSRLRVTIWDPDAEEGTSTRVVELSANQIKEAYQEAKRREYRLCCARTIESDELGAGCAQDLDIVIQTACFGRLVYG